MKLVGEWAICGLLGLAMVGCGGGGGGSAAPANPGTGTSSLRTSVTSGMAKQVVFAGGTASKPIWVVVTNSDTSRAVSGVTVTFSADPGVEIMPTSVNTSNTGVARAMVRLPDVPFHDYTVTATAASGGSYQFQMTTGPRVTRVFGNLSVAEKAGVTRDGRVASADGLNADGSVRYRGGATLQRINIPDPPSDSRLGQNGKLYFVVDEMLLVFDDAMNLQQALDLHAINADAANVTPIGFSLPVAVDSQGNLIYHSANGVSQITFSRFGPDGKLIERNSPLPLEYVRGVQVNAKGNYVVLQEIMSTPVFFDELIEFTRTGTVVRRQALPVERAWTELNLGQNEHVYVGAERWVDGTPATLPTLEFDENFALLRTVNAPGRLFGADQQGMLFLHGGAGGLVKTDSSGVVSWSRPPEVLTNSFAYNPANGELWNSTLEPQYGLIWLEAQRFKDGVFLGRITLPTIPGVSYPPTRPGPLAFGPSGLMYDAYSEGINQESKIAVWDTNLNLLRTFAIPGCSNALAVAADSSIYAIGNSSTSSAKVCVIDASDTIISQTNISAVPYADVAVAASPDGNIVVSVRGGLNATVTKMSRSGAVLWTYGGVLDGGIAVDSKNRVFTSSGVLDSTGKLLGPMPFAVTGLVSLGDHVLANYDGRLYELSAE